MNAPSQPAPHNPNVAVHPNYRTAALRLMRSVFARGINAAPILRSVGIAEDLRTNTVASVRGQQMIRLLGAVKEVLGDEFFGLTAHRSKPDTLALMVEMALHCDTLIAAIEQMLRADRLLTDDRTITLTLEQDDVVLRFAQTHPEYDPDHFLADHWLLHWHRMLSWLTGYLIPLKRVDLVVAEMPTPERLSYYICGDWNPGQPVPALVFSRKYASLPIVRTRSEWLQHLAHGAQGTPVWPEGGMRWSTRVRALLSNALAQRHQCLEFDAVAAALSLTTQTLRRYLRDEGTGFQTLRDEARRDAAIEKLHVQHLNVNDVALQLGFAEPRSFSRAFKQWTGVSPSAYQKLPAARLSRSTARKLTPKPEGMPD
jgi:AraC-like DNA-binding protein